MGILGQISQLDGKIFRRVFVSWILIFDIFGFVKWLRWKLLMIFGCPNWNEINGVQFMNIWLFYKFNRLTREGMFRFLNKSLLKKDKTMQMYGREGFKNPSDVLYEWSLSTFPQFCQFFRSFGWRFFQRSPVNRLTSLCRAFLVEKTLFYSNLSWISLKLVIVEFLSFWNQFLKNFNSELARLAP